MHTPSEGKSPSTSGITQTESEHHPSWDNDAAKSVHGALPGSQCTHSGLAPLQQSEPPALATTNPGLTRGAKAWLSAESSLQPLPSRHGSNAGLSAMTVPQLENTLPEVDMQHQQHQHQLMRDRQRTQQGMAADSLRPSGSVSATPQLSSGLHNGAMLGATANVTAGMTLGAEVPGHARHFAQGPGSGALPPTASNGALTEPIMQVPITLLMRLLLALRHPRHLVHNVIFDHLAPRMCPLIRLSAECVAVGSSRAWSQSGHTSDGV